MLSIIIKSYQKQHSVCSLLNLKHVAIYVVTFEFSVLLLFSSSLFCFLCVVVFHFINIEKMLFVDSFNSVVHCSVIYKTIASTAGVMLFPKSVNCCCESAFNAVLCCVCKLNWHDLIKLMILLSNERHQQQQKKNGSASVERWFMAQ